MSNHFPSHNRVSSCFHSVLQDRVDAVEEILLSASEKLVVLRQILRKLPDLPKGLCRIQYGKVRREVLFSSQVIHSTMFSCTVYTPRTFCPFTCF